MTEDTNLGSNPHIEDNPHLDAIALVAASDRHDGRAMAQIIEGSDMKSLVCILAQMVNTAVGPRQLPAFLDMLTEKAIGKANEQAIYGGGVSEDD